jgi:hypothetical protein
MVNLSRRGFLGVLGATAAAVIIMPSAKLWVPEEAQIVLPEVTEAAKAEGLICGWYFDEAYGVPDDAWLASDAFGYFPHKAPLMILKEQPWFAFRQPRSRGFMRFIYRGTGAPARDGRVIPVVATWADYHALIAA